MGSNGVQTVYVPVPSETVAQRRVIERARSGRSRLWIRAVVQSVAFEREAGCGRDIAAAGEDEVLEDGAVLAFDAEVDKGPAIGRWRRHGRHCDQERRCEGEEGRDGKHIGSTASVCDEHSPPHWQQHACRFICLLEECPSRCWEDEPRTQMTMADGISCGLNTH